MERLTIEEQNEGKTKDLAVKTALVWLKELSEAERKEFLEGLNSYEQAETQGLLDIIESMSEKDFEEFLASSPGDSEKEDPSASLFERLEPVITKMSSGDGNQEK